MLPRSIANYLVGSRDLLARREWGMEICLWGWVMFITGALYEVKPRKVQPNRTQVADHLLHLSHARFRFINKRPPNLVFFPSTPPFSILLQIILFAWDFLTSGACVLYFIHNLYIKKLCKVYIRMVPKKEQLLLSLNGRCIHQSIQ